LCEKEARALFKRRLSLLIPLGLCLAAFLGMAASLRYGAKGDDVLVLQENLSRLGYFHAAPTGYYGGLTALAVKQFQADCGLNPDGVAGETTLAAIHRALTHATGQVSSRGRSDAVAMLPWELVNQLWPNGTTARVYDLDSGLCLIAWRLYGSLHADVEPLTKYDTYQLKRIYGGTWSWARRAVIVELNGRYIAASMNGMPHGHYEILDNDFPGQFCIHFLGSALHKNHHVDAQHQAMVMKAARAGLPGLVRPADENAVDAPPEELSGMTVQPPSPSPDDPNE
jgi:hypothetical protein